MRNKMICRAAAVLFMSAALLSGCDAWSGEEYTWIEKVELPRLPESGQQFSASNYFQLQNVLKSMVESGKSQQAISVANYPANKLEEDIERAVEALRLEHPIAAYAVEAVTWETGTSAGEPVLAVEIQYLHDKTDIRNIITVENNAQAEDVIAKALADCQQSMVLQIRDYMPQDFTQVVENYGFDHPEIVMELPQVTENVYPDMGKTRVVELKFSYQTNRESLKTMQGQVAPVFSSAVLYVSGDGDVVQKYSQLYTFLMERFDYAIETSITPAYSLLRHGVGDSRAFAVVYAAMCRQAGLECIVVSGTKDGVSHYWNIIAFNGSYYHLDLLCCSEAGWFFCRTDEQMDGHVWDYSAYPACDGQILPEQMLADE